MQAQAATDTLLTNQLPAVRPKNHLLEDAKLSPLNPGDLIPTDTVAHGTTGDTLVGWRGWGTNPRELRSGIGQRLMRNATYRLSCMIQMDPLFRDA